MANSKSMSFCLRKFWVFEVSIRGDAFVDGLVDALIINKAVHINVVNTVCWFCGDIQNIYDAGYISLWKGVIWHSQLSSC